MPVDGSVISAFAVPPLEKDFSLLVTLVPPDVHVDIDPAKVGSVTFSVISLPEVPENVTRFR